LFDISSFSRVACDPISPNQAGTNTFLQTTIHLSKRAPFG
jgi:hypothetical protein